MNGPDELYLKVTGNPQPVEFIKDPYEAEMHVTVSFNSLYEDPEQQKELRETIIQAAQLDPSGRIDMEAGIDMILNMADPTIADRLLLPTEDGQAKIVKETQGPMAIFSGGRKVALRRKAADMLWMLPVAVQNTMELVNG